ncbi:MAG: alpha/beta hydrolase [Parvularculales bacterium]
MTQMTRRSLERDTGAVSFLEWCPPSGEHRPALHFAHATGFNAHTYKELLSPLAAQFHVWASDARGHGTTDLPTPEEMAQDWSIYRDDLIHVLETIVHETGEPVLLAGHSMGGTTSMMAAVKRPDLVRGLALLDPVLIPRSAYSLVHWAHLLHLPSPGGASSLATSARRRRTDWPSRETAIRAWQGKGAFRSWPETMLRDYVEDGMRDTKDGVTLSCRPAWEAATFESRSHNALKLIRQMSHSFAVLYAQTGSTCRPLTRVALRQKRSLAFMECCLGASHFLPMEKPEHARNVIERLSALC